MAVATAVAPRSRQWIVRPNVFTAILGGIIGFVLFQWVFGHDGGLLTQSGPFGNALGFEIDQINLLAYAALVLGFFIGLGYFNYPVKWLFGYRPTAQEQAEEYGVGLGAEKYFRLCLDHKVVGIQYLVTVIAFF